MSEKTIKHATGQCLGEEFYVDERWRFFVVFLDKSYETYEAMKSAIEAANKRDAAKKKTKISVEIMSNKGKLFTVTSIHAGHGKIVTKPKPERYGDNLDQVFPQVEWIQEAIAKAKALRGQASHIDKCLEKFSVTMPGSYRHSLGKYASPEEYVEGEIAKAQAKAEATDLADCLANTSPPKDIEL